MSNLFSGLTLYRGKWSIKDGRNFNDEEKSMVSSIEVVDSDYGLSACFHMSSGGNTYIPMSRDSDVVVGEVLDIDRCKVLTLERAGEQDINRIDY